ncbi:monocarboxylate transporter 13 [Lingula anatina]|uniref:Monocarboxylate transporter 13 n=1 Tax=Lingula anatina TaxID=7574 RepID=A0A1S3KAL8_LINAN|nr:monocarboxylate transporter 13 [Lingula anatina]|eukprot:XP_013419665.1 monocarboxylate transporter 13 [Lingula anatina]
MVPVCYGCGTGLVYTATTVCVGQYFHKRRPMALGITTAGMALGQIVCPPLFQFLIDTYTWRGSAFMVAGLCLNNCVFGTIMKPPTGLYNTDREADGSRSTHVRDPRETKCITNNGSGHLKKESYQIHTDVTKIDDGLQKDMPNEVIAENSNTHCYDDGSKHTDLPARLVNGNKHSTLGSSAFLSLSSAAFSSMASNLSQLFASNNHIVVAEDRTNFGCMAYVRGLLDIRPLKSAAFISFSISVFFFAAAYVTCGVHLIAYTVQHGTSPLQAAILLSVYGAGNLFSRLLAGAATNDKEHVDQVTLGAGVMGISALLSFCLPLFIHSYWSQVLFAALYGNYSTVILPLFTTITVETVGLSSLGAGFGYLMVLNGIGCAVGPPIAGYLYDLTGDYSYSFYLAGILFIGGSLMLLAIPVLESRRHQMEEKREHRCS